MGRTLSEKVWDEHVVRSAEGEPDLLFIDLHLIHEVTSPQAFDGLRLAGAPYAVPTSPWPPRTTTSPRSTGTSRSPTRSRARRSRRCARTPRSSASGSHPLGDVEQGIVHVIGPQLGLTQPGMTIVCGDSHTSTHGAFGAIAFGIGTSEVEHVLATQTLTQAAPEDDGRHRQRRPARRRHRQGPRAHADRADRHRRRPGLHRGVPRPGHRGALDGGPDDDLQHVHRVGRQGRPDRPRPDHLRLHRGPPRGAEGRRLGRRGRALEVPASPTTTPSSTRRSCSTPRR